MTIVCVCVYDRIENLKSWLRVWPLCETEDSKLVIIHNVKSEKDREDYSHLCNLHGAIYIPHKNIGFDIARLQDLCNDNLPGIPEEWDIVIWCTDDTLPMHPNFIRVFVNALSDEFIVSAMEICESQNTRRVRAKKHIRTTGFCMTRETARLLTFPATPVTTKEQCYHFEHRSDGTLLDQVTRMGKRAAQVAPINESPLWDQGRPAQAHRKSEHYRTFPLAKPPAKKVAFICTIYNSYPVMIAALKNQTHENWHLYLVHDGKNDTGLRKLVEHHNDPRIEFIETDSRVGNYGHENRQWMLNQVKDGVYASDSDYIIVGNSDNYYVPIFIEEMLKGFDKNPDCVAGFCSRMQHSYIKWGIIECRMKLGYIDAGNVMVRKDVAASVGWNSMIHSSDFVYFQDIVKIHSINKFFSVPGLFFTHN